MGRKRKRSVRPRQESPPPRDRKKRSEFKRARVKEFIKNGLTKKDMDERRERYDCMKNHPGRYCSNCNPRLNEEIEEDEEDEDVDWSDESAELSDTWSDDTEDDLGKVSVTYSEAWYDEEELQNTTRFLKERVSFVDAAAARLEKEMSMENASDLPVGELAGRWDFYNVDVCPKKFVSDEYFSFYITKLATNGPLPPGFVFDEDHPLESYIQWQIHPQSGGVVPFQIPTYASLKPIPIKLDHSTKHEKREISAEIIFLGSGCMRLRVPRDTVQDTIQDTGGEIGKETGMLEFAGIHVIKAIKADGKTRWERVKFY